MDSQLVFQGLLSEVRAADGYDEGKIAFQIGGKYRARATCDHDCIFEFKILRRTKKMIWLYDYLGRREVRRKINLRQGVESVYPFGRYSMCPILRASNPIHEVSP